MSKSFCIVISTIMYTALYIKFISLMDILFDNLGQSP